MKNSNVSISYSPIISYEKANVFQMVSEAFYMLGMDKDNYGTPEWNPLREYVHPGDKVLIKPNLVMHNNPSGEGTECLYTHPSVVDVVIQYVLVALNGAGSIIVGDAPMQGCRFDELTEESGYGVLIDKYKKRKIDIELRDFRNTVSESMHGVVMEKELRNHESVAVDLGEKSSFSGLSKAHLKNMRVTDYDPRILQKHHAPGKHEYLIAKEILYADVVINMPKPKTHRKAGVTGALKNLVGINSSKEYLPHHTRQGRQEHGDAFLHKSLWLRLADTYADKKCMSEKEHHYRHALLCRYMGGLFLRIGRKVSHERFSEGSWYGNDTIWRTILDLNKIMQYADKDGRICKERQRRILNVGDMIVSGEKDGPVCPSRKEAGIIIVGEDPCSFDETVVALMGFDGKKIPTISHMRSADPKIFCNQEYDILSNNDVWNHKGYWDIYKKHNLRFIPNPGWKEVL